MLPIRSGLRNIGNSCFFNAMLQALFSIPAIVRCLQDKIDNNAPSCKCVSCVFLELYKNTRLNKVCDPTRLYCQLLEASRKKFSNVLNFKQQDAHEFLVLFTEFVENDLHSPFSFDEMFASNIVTEIECSRCKNVLRSSSTVSEFQLDVYGHVTVKNAFHSYFNDQSVDFYCETCKYKYASTKKTFLLAAPQCIMLTLKRFSKFNKKWNGKIELARDINLSEYFYQSQALQWNYKLVAVVNHAGRNPNSGHYTTISCTEENEHYQFDDSNVHKVDANRVTGDNAYMLFYEYIEEMEQMTDVDMIDLDSSKAIGRDSQSPINDLKQLNGDSEQRTADEVNKSSLNHGLEQRTELEDSAIPSELYINNKEIPQSTENETQYEIRDGLQNENISDECDNRLSGRRIVDIEYFIKQMQDMTENVCKLCNNGNMIFSSEFKRGLISIFTFQCNNCGNSKRIESTPVKNCSAANPNEGSVVGVISIGLGFYHLQEFLAHLNIKCMSYPTFHKLEKRFQADWWKLAKKFEADALHEEIQLSKENFEVDSAGNALVGVEFDGSWEKRSYRNNFTSLAGCAAIIGRRTNKIIYSGVRTKYCHVCKIAQSKNSPANKHECNANYVGPSSGMETEIVIDGFKFCEEKNARFHYYVGDGDCSTYKALKDLRLYKNPDMDVEKYECENHIYRNFTKACEKLSDVKIFKKKVRKLLPSTLGNNII